MSHCILVVDDDPSFLSVVADFLQDAGYDVLAAINGLHALRLLRQRQPDVLVTDLQMPLLDGFELVRACRAETALRDLPIVVFSADLPSGLPEAAAIGVQAIVSKPCDLSLLLAKISHVLSR